MSFNGGILVMFSRMEKQKKVLCVLIVAVWIAALIIYAGQKFSSIYEDLLKWGLEFRALSVDDEWTGVINTLSKMWESPIANIEQYMLKYEKGMEEAAMHLNERTGDDQSVPVKTIDLSLTIEEPDLDEFYVELTKLKKRLGFTVL